MGNPSGATTDINNPNNYLMEKTQYVLSYSRDRGTPNWVSWHLDSTWLGSAPRQDDFRPDPAVPSSWYRVQDDDYSGSGFDRGHMTPSADRTSTVADNSATFLMTNFIPQSPDNNRGPWEKFESYLRTQVAAGNELYIISGPSGVGGQGSNGAASTVANGHVTVPQKTWKVVLVLPVGDSDVSRVNASTRTIAVIMPNTQGISSDSWQKYLATVDQVEALTGYDFFSNVPVNIQNVIESRADALNNATPVAANQTINTAQNTPVNVTLTATDANVNSSLTYSIVSGPSHGTLSGTPPALTYTPAANYNGTDSFTFKANDSAADSNTATVNITVTATTPNVSLTSNTFTVNENDASGAAVITVSRAGDNSSAISVDYTTADQSGMTPCQNNSNGVASERCDYATAVGTLRFAAGEQSKSIQIPIINDAYVEQPEVFNIILRNPQGATLGAITASSVTINSDDTQAATSNPINLQDFFIREQYVDFLGRVAEPGGFDFWNNRMNGNPLYCPAGDICDRVDTAKRFFESDEFKERGFYVYKLYDALLGRFPLYSEFVPEVARLNGPQTVTEQRLGKDAYLLDFMAKAEFKALYDQYLTPDHLHARDATNAAAFVDALCNKAGITPASKASLTANLQNGTRDPAHTLEDFILTAEINGDGTKFYDRARIVMQYFGFLRRDPDTGGFNFWWNRVATVGSPQYHDYRELVDNFLRSDEYNFRFAFLSA
jgi:endonuclease G